MTKALAEKRLLSAPGEDESDTLSELDHEYESIARRFVAAWGRNPSLVTLLKKGFSLFPDPYSCVRSVMP